MELGRNIIKVTSLEKGCSQWGGDGVERPVRRLICNFAWRAVTRYGQDRASCTVSCGDEGKKGVKTDSSAVLG